MKEKPLISIITPSYNQGEFIEENILSIRCQDYPHFEHWIMDGASKDSTVSIIEKYQGTYELKWVSEPDKGQVDALNKGFARTTGDILCWLNSDDTYLTSTVLSQVISLFDTYPQVDVVTGGGVMMDRNGKWINVINFDPAHINYQSLRRRNFIIQPATFIRKAALSQTALDPNLHYAFDWDLWIRLAKNYNILPVNSVWAGYRWWGENKTASGSSKRTKEQREVIGRYLGRSTWQYGMMSMYYLLYRLSETLPNRPSRVLKSMIHSSSAWVSELTRKRIPVV